jgi:predicted deacylase
VDALVAGGMQPRLMLDFHSTGSNLFYTQLPSETTEPLAFATRWLTASRARLPDYDFKHDPRGISERPTTKNYFYKRFAIPAITYETGDETDPADIESSARVFAQEMMRLMLEYADAGP